MPGDTRVSIHMQRSSPMLPHNLIPKDATPISQPGTAPGNSRVHQKPGAGQSFRPGDYNVRQQSTRPEWNPLSYPPMPNQYSEVDTYAAPTNKRAKFEQPNSSQNPSAPQRLSVSSQSSSTFTAPSKTTLISTSQPEFRQAESVMFRKKRRSARTTMLTQSEVLVEIGSQPRAQTTTSPHFESKDALALDNSLDGSLIPRRLRDGIGSSFDRPPTVTVFTRKTCAKIRESKKANVDERIQHNGFAKAGHIQFPNTIFVADEEGSTVKRHEAGSSGRLMRPVRKVMDQNLMDMDSSVDELSGPATIAPATEGTWAGSSEQNHDTQRQTRRSSKQQPLHTTAIPRSVNNLELDSRPAASSSSMKSARKSQQIENYETKEIRSFSRAASKLVKEVVINLVPNSEFITFSRNLRPFQDFGTIGFDKLHFIDVPEPQSKSQMIRVNFKARIGQDYISALCITLLHLEDVGRLKDNMSKSCPGLKINERTSEEMEKIFNHKRSEMNNFENRLSFPTPKAVDEGQEDHWLEQRADSREDQKITISQLSTKTDSSQQRLKHSPRDSRCPWKITSDTVTANKLLEDQGAIAETTLSIKDKMRDSAKAETKRYGTSDTPADSNQNNLHRRTLRSRNALSVVEILHDPNQVEKFSKVHGLGEPWDAPVVYPPDGRKTTVQFDDLKLLDEGEWLNDTIIEYQINALLYRFKDAASRVYPFSTQFFTALTSHERSGLNFNAVKKWTAKVDIFSYDFAIVPINENAHWYLAIIANLGNIRKSEQDVEVDEKSIIGGDKGIAQSPILSLFDGKRIMSEGAPTHTRGELGDYASGRSRRSSTYGGGQLTVSMSSRDSNKAKPSPRKYVPGSPSIIILDSLGTARPLTIRRLKDYLIAESMDKRNVEIDTKDIQGFNPRNNIPKQDNLSDCGLFILGYLEKFMSQPGEFITKLLTQTLDLNRDWVGVKPSKMRAMIREQLQRIAAQQKDNRQLQREERRMRKGLDKNQFTQVTASSPIKSTETAMEDVSAKEPNLTSYPASASTFMSPERNVDNARTVFDENSDTIGMQGVVRNLEDVSSAHNRAGDAGFDMGAEDPRAVAADEDTMLLDEVEIPESPPSARTSFEYHNDLPPGFMAQLKEQATGALTPREAVRTPTRQQIRMPFLADGE